MADGPKILWKVDAVVGHSNVAIKDNRLYTVGTNGIFCFDAKSGDELWKYEITTTGPAATPAIDGRVSVHPD